MSATETGAQSPKDEVSVSEYLDNVSQFIDSVYRDLTLSPTPDHHNNTLSISQRRSLPAFETSFNSSPEGATGGVGVTSEEEQSQANSSIENELEEPRRRSSYRRRNVDACIERIDRVCADVDAQLRTIGIFVNNDDRGSSTNSSDTNAARPHSPIPVDTNPRRGRSRQLSRISEVVDLNEAIIVQPSHINEIEVTDNVPNQPVVRTPTAAVNEIVVPDDDDEVVVVSSNLPPVIDLCTPNHEVPPTRRSVVNRNELTRRNLERHERINDEVVAVPVRRRRVSKAPVNNESDISHHSDPEPNSSGESLDHTPFMCPVCMESCLKRRPTSTKCGHVFCEHCIKQAIRLTHKCPMCKTKISCGQLIRIYV